MGFSVIVMFGDARGLGRSEVVDLLLRNGARSDAVNKIGKTAAQLGGFVGRYDVQNVA